MSDAGRFFTDRFVLDVGGEGRHRTAWNLNPRTERTVRPHRGRPIRRLIRGRGEAIPLPPDSVDVLIVERTPLRTRTLEDIRRVVKPGGWIILRHAAAPLAHPHVLARRLLPGSAHHAIVRIGRQDVLQTTFRLGLSLPDRCPRRPR
jgi:SAM-dependent methyltransferase